MVHCCSCCAQLPNTMHQSSLDDVLLIAKQCEIEHIAKHAMVTAQMLDALEEQGVIGEMERHSVLNEVKKVGASRSGQL